MKVNSLKLRDLKNIWSMLNLLRSKPIEPMEFFLDMAKSLGFDKLDKQKCETILSMLATKFKEELYD